MTIHTFQWCLLYEMCCIDGASKCENLKEEGES